MSSGENCSMDADVPENSHIEIPSNQSVEPMCVTEDAERCRNEGDESTDAGSNTIAACTDSSKGISLTELHKVFGPWGPPPLPPVRPSTNHTVLYKLPWRDGCVPQSYPAVPCDRWDQEHVRMPNSSESVYPVQETEDEKGLRLRWELVQEALLRNIGSSHQLESAILSYNSRYNERWNFRALHSLFNEVLDREESDYFFRDLLPKMVNLALRIPELVTGPIPLLKKHQNHSISLSQLQIGSILANAFFCTFPRRNSTKRGSEYSAYPDINFNRLFQCGDTSDSGSTYEKLKCILNYFRRICISEPQGVVTFSRRYIAPGSFPNWSRSTKFLPKLHITSTGCIEDEGAGMLQVDFANKFVGGGVLGWGCVQEEIRFVICPELIISRLFTECLDSTEALIIVGCERFSSYRGYGHSFEWLNDFVDPTPYDSAGRRHCSIVAMDALCFSNPSSQYTLPNITREVNKAYVGFCETEDREGNSLAPVATGNWGCGAFRGDANLKVLLQLMAAGEACRPLVYFTFGDNNLRDRIFRMYNFLVGHSVTVGKLWNLISQYSRISSAGGAGNGSDLYEYLYDSVEDAAMGKDLKPTISFKRTSAKQQFTNKENLNTSNNCPANSSTKKAISVSGVALTEEDLDNLIEEFDSEPETMEATEVPEPIKETATSSCLSLMEEGLQRDKTKKTAEHPLKNLKKSELMEESEVSERIQKTDVVNTAGSSCLSLIEEDLERDQVKKQSEFSLKNRRSVQHRNTSLLDSSSTRGNFHTQNQIVVDGAASKPEERFSNSQSEDMAASVPENKCSTSSLSSVEQYSTPSEARKEEGSAASSSLPLSAKSQRKSSAPKRKISDYFNPM